MGLEDLQTTVAALPAFLIPLVVFASSLLEYVFPPYWGDTLILLGFFLAGQGAASWVEIFVAAVAGAIVGAAVAYGIGKRYGMRAVRRFSRRRRRRSRSRERVQRLFQRYGEPILLINRFLPVVRGMMLYAAGAMELRPRPVMFYSSIGSFAWVLLMMGLGWWAGDTLEQLESTFAQSSRVIGTVAAVIFVAWLGWLAWRYFRPRNGVVTEPTSDADAADGSRAESTDSAR